MAAKVTCETVNVIVESDDGSASFTIPAYTREKDEFSRYARKLLQTYVRGSEQTGDGMSVGDLALYLLRVASYEPRTQ